MTPAVRRTVLTGMLALAGVLLRAQPTQVEVSSYAFSNGVHPTFATTLHTERTSAVEDHWRSVLKGVSRKVEGRRELLARTALLPAISPDTMQVLIKAVTQKGSGVVTCHVAFHTTDGYVGPGSAPEQVEAARAYVREHTRALRLSLARRELTTAERLLAQQRRDLSTLQRDHERAAAQQTRQLEKDSLARAEQAEGRTAVGAKQAELDAFRAQMGTSVDPADQEKLRTLEKELQKLRAKLTTAERNARTAQDRAEALVRNMERNRKAQGDMAVRIERQEALVEELRARLAAIQ